jgi:mRNA interferase MazF
MKPGDVVLTPIRQADGVIKNRPALVLREMPADRDLPVCGISTQLHQEVKGFDDLILRSHSDFAESSLKSDSLIRLGFLALLPKKDIIGTIGSVSPERHRPST